MYATMREINETEDSSGKNKRNETLVEKEHQGIKVTQEEKEEEQNNRGKMEDRNKEEAEEVKDSNDEEESSNGEDYSKNGDNAKQAPQAREKGMGREPSDEEYSNSSDEISEEVEKQEKKGRGQGDEMWNPGQVLDDGWEIHGQERWEKSYDIWGG